jgi:hypothetical protein
MKSMSIYRTFTCPSGHLAGEHRGAAVARCGGDILYRPRVARHGASRGSLASRRSSGLGVRENLGMSYDLAVWEGDRPTNDAAAAAEFDALYARFVESEESVEPTARIAAYVAALLDRYPDIGTDAGEDSPWSTGPLLSEASGPLVYFPMVWSRCDEVSAWAAEVAEQHGLNCYDPQMEQLRTSWSQPWRVALTSAHGRVLRDPELDIVRRVLTRLSADDYFAVLTRSDDWYIQVGYGERAGVRHGWYALERRDGSPEEHYRVELTSVEDVIDAFDGFLRQDSAISLRFAWQPYAV